MEFKSLNEAAKYSHVTRQAIYVAIIKGELVAKKRHVNGREQWSITKADLDAYRASKYNSDKRKCAGKRVFDLSENRWSVLHAHKVLSQMLGRPYPAHHIYYLLRIGQLKGSKLGGSWIVTKESLLELYEQEREKDLQKEAN